MSSAKKHKLETVKGLREERSGLPAPDDSAWEENYIREREPVHRQLFPGDPERAQRLGRLFELLGFKIEGNVVPLDGADRYDMLRALQLLLAHFIDQYARPSSLPAKPPALWADRDPHSSINPAEFTRKTYAKWLGRSLTRKHLRDLDPQLYRALSVWEHRHPEDRITELPTLREVIDQKIAALSTEFSEEELRKLGTTLQTRLRRMKK